ncbi:hypothetical protein EVAR_77006_1 [Eumeta japonica]|uniref:Uncharacterized protein n=1 Tax=Eumeta variegata TaxID=151549 RepID=A0A4C1SHX6_EUMVA|nr:hypothetical protein EVAR_77006_1 [Eumeta japonica]
MMARNTILIIILATAITVCEMRKKTKDKPSEKELLLQRRETTPADFTRLLVMRLIYGVAKMMGLQEPVSEVLGGALVPPGADDDDDDEFDEGGLFDDDDDY